MTVLPAAVLIIAVALVAGACALAAFFWAIRTGQFSHRQLEAGPFVVFDSPDEIGHSSDQILDTSAHTDE